MLSLLSVLSLIHLPSFNVCFVFKKLTVQPIRPIGFIRVRNKVFIYYNLRLEIPPKSSS